MGTFASASALRAGSQVAVKAYFGSTLVWGAPVIDPDPVPSTTFWYSFDAGTAGDAVATGDSGSGTPFDNVSYPYMTYTTPGRSGSGKCGQIPTGASMTSYVQWDGTATATLALGMWAKFAAAPTGDTRVMDIRSPSSTVGGVLLQSSRSVRLMVGTSGVTARTSSPLTLGEWYWISLGWNCTTKSVRLTVHDSSGTSFYDSGAVIVSSSFSTATTGRFGRVTTAGDIGACQFDDIQFDQASAVPLLPWGIPVP